MPTPNRTKLNHKNYNHSYYEHNILYIIPDIIFNLIN